MSYTVGEPLSGPLWEKAKNMTNRFYKPNERGSDAYFEYAEKVYDKLKKGTVKKKRDYIK